MTVTEQASASGAQNGASIECVMARLFDEDINSDGFALKGTVFCHIVAGAYELVLGKSAARSAWRAKIVPPLHIRGYGHS